MYYCALWLWKTNYSRGRAPSSGFDTLNWWEEMDANCQMAMPGTWDQNWVWLAEMGTRGIKTSTLGFGSQWNYLCYSTFYILPLKHTPTHNPISSNQVFAIQNKVSISQHTSLENFLARSSIIPAQLIVEEETTGSWFQSYFEQKCARKIRWPGHKI